MHETTRISCISLITLLLLVGCGAPSEGPSDVRRLVATLPDHKTSADGAVFLDMPGRIHMSGEGLLEAALVVNQTTRLHNLEGTVRIGDGRADSGVLFIILWRESGWTAFRGECIAAPTDLIAWAPTPEFEIPPFDGTLSPGRWTLLVQTTGSAEFSAQVGDRESSASFSIGGFSQNYDSVLVRTNPSVFSSASRYEVSYEVALAPIAHPALVFGTFTIWAPAPFATFDRMYSSATVDGAQCDVHEKTASSARQNSTIHRAPLSLLAGPEVDVALAGEFQGGAQAQPAEVRIRTDAHIVWKRE